ncbi:MAG: hypothetical protein JWQ21_718 [Herminiimonas sp.]|nr:hypothetical protein [Herminiimonas sp.]
MLCARFCHGELIVFYRLKNYLYLGIDTSFNAFDASIL